MGELHVGLALLLLGTLVAGTARILRGPTPPDRMLAAQLMGTTVVAVLLLLAEGLGTRALADVALVFALLAAVAAVALVRRGWPPPPEGSGDGRGGQ
ncbi:MAG: monovalent cation/H+ antiporter complex subunit F [Deferrisomatales bacterium]|nr:monovalent cation/H+ antiporter complex subunit F [Deferrisomatales bacterium]